jgi:hypothetical protein
MTDRRVTIGVVGVDSGQLVICDPCYIDHEGKHKELNDYDHMLDLRAQTGGGDLNHAEHFLQLKYDKGHAGLGVLFNSGIGDGAYEVIATIGDVPGWGERVKKVEVILVVPERAEELSEYFRSREYQEKAAKLGPELKKRVEGAKK